MNLVLIIIIVIILYILHYNYLYFEFICLIYFNIFIYTFLVNEWFPSNNRKILKAEVMNNYIMLKYSDSKILDIIKINNEKYVFIVLFILN